MEGEIEHTNNSQIKNTDVKKELNLKEEYNIPTANQENITNNVNNNNDPNILINKSFQNEVNEDNEAKEEQMDFEQIKKNHMQTMNNLNMSQFESNSLSNYNKAPIYMQNNQLNNFAYNINNNSNNNFNLNTMNYINPNIVLQGMPMPPVPNQAPFIMPTRNANLPFIPPPPRFSPANQMLMMQNKNYFFDCNPFALFMKKKLISGNVYNANSEIKEQSEEKPYFFSFSNTLLTNNPNKNQDENSKEFDLTKMTRFNVKFINPFNGSK